MSTRKWKEEGKGDGRGRSTGWRAAKKIKGGGSQGVKSKSLIYNKKSPGYFKNNKN